MGIQFFVTDALRFTHTSMGKTFIDGMESHIELDGFTARHYDRLMDILSFGLYPRFITSAMKSLGTRPGDRILDLGCGTGRNLSILYSLNGGQGSYHGIDIGEDMLNQARQRFRGKENVAVLNASILETLPFDQPFDHVTTSFVLHGFSHSQRLDIARQAHASLRPGGTFSFLDWSPADPADWPAWFRFFFRRVECPIAYDFIQHDYAADFEALGFRHLSIHPRIRGLARVVRLEKTS